MNAPIDPMSPLDASWLDRLVDGELEEPERRQLLERLEVEPEGWRRCALAFLEAQAWREAVGTLASEVEDGAVPPAPVVPFTPTARAASWPRRLAWAAGVVAAFGLGWSVGATGPAPGPTREIAREIALPDGPPTAVEPVATPYVAGAEPVPEASDGAGDSSFLPTAMTPAPISDEGFRQQLERQGYRVGTTPGWLISRGPDGPTRAVPVEQVRVRFVGSQTY